MPLADRKANLEGFQLGFMAYHSLPFSMASELLQFAQVMATDEKVNHILYNEKFLVKLLILTYALLKNDVSDFFTSVFNLPILLSMILIYF